MAKASKKVEAAKEISGVAYVAYQADLASREGEVSARLADLFFQCACIEGTRTLEEWDRLVLAARRAEVRVKDVLEFGEDDDE